MAERVVSVERIIPAPPKAIFDVLADPNRHPEIDGSGTVKATRSGAPTRLSEGATFGMDMKIGVPYPIKNTVVEFDEDKRIAWRHFGGHVWRYTLEPVDGGTKVTEQFDYRPSKAPWFLEMMKYPERHVSDMEKTLERLDAVATATD